MDDEKNPSTKSLKNKIEHYEEQEEEHYEEQNNEEDY